MRLLRFLALLGTLLIAVRAPAQNARKPCNPTKVFLIHGIGQTGANMNTFKWNLIDQLESITNPATHRKFVVEDSAVPFPTGSPRPDLIVDNSFSFACAANPGCGNCSCPAPPCDCGCAIDDGATLLATTVSQLTAPYDHVVLVGYSMGGLIARDMILNATKGWYSGSQLLQRKITALVTLGTPNLGYPWASIDDLAASAVVDWPDLLAGVLPNACPVQADLMGSDFRTGQSASPYPTVALMATPSSVQLPRSWLDTVTNGWSHITWPSNWSNLYWEAISGSYCNTAVRTYLDSNYGCPNYNPLSDGVVCDESARYQPPSSPWTVDYFTHQTYDWPPNSADAYSDYGHTSGSILCKGTSANSILWAPEPGDALTRMVALVVGLSK
jgi:pimeloyl-ACP methyl ester carboxylesterase